MIFFRIIFFSILMIVSLSLKSQTRFNIKTGLGINNIFAKSNEDVLFSNNFYKYNAQLAYQVGLGVSKKISKNKELCIGLGFINYYNNATSPPGLNINGENTVYKLKMSFSYISAPIYIKHHFNKYLGAVYGINNQFLVSKKEQNGLNLSYYSFKTWSPEVLFGLSVNPTEKFEISITGFFDVRSFSDNFLESINYTYHRYGAMLNLSYQIFSHEKKDK